MPVQLYSAPMKYKDQNGDYQNIIGISGNPGRGIASVVLNNDYTLTINFTDNTSTTTGSIRGNGIESIEKTSTAGVVDTYTITDSDGGTSTFTVENGVTPSLSIGTVVEGQAATATITGTADAPVLNLVLPAANLSNYVQKTDYATANTAGIIKTGNALITGLGISNGLIYVVPASDEQIQSGNYIASFISTSKQHAATFYGLAKAAGDSTQSASSNAVGTYTDEAKAAIQQMLDVPSNSDIPDVSVYATKTGTILNTTLSRGRKAGTNVGEASIAFGTSVEAGGVCSTSLGCFTSTKAASTFVAGAYNVPIERFPDWSAGTHYNPGDRALCPVPVAGFIMPLPRECITENSDEVWDESKWKIIPVSKDSNQLFVLGNGIANNIRSNAYALDWEGNGHYMGDVYVGCNADSSGGTKLATIEDIPSVPVQDVQVAGTSVVGNDGVATIPLATSSQIGVVSVGDYGISVSGANNTLVLSAGAPTETKTGTNIYRPVVVGRQHQSVFYGLSKVAGVDLANETVTLGTYPEASKTAIKQMLGVQDGLKVVRLI